MAERPPPHLDRSERAAIVNEIDRQLATSVLPPWIMLLDLLRRDVVAADVHEALVLDWLDASHRPVPATGPPSHTTPHPHPTTTPPPGGHPRPPHPGYGAALRLPGSTGLDISDEVNGESTFSGVPESGSTKSECSLEHRARSSSSCDRHGSLIVTPMAYGVPDRPHFFGGAAARPPPWWGPLRFSGPSRWAVYCPTVRVNHRAGQLVVSQVMTPQVPGPCSANRGPLVLRSVRIDYQHLDARLEGPVDGALQVEIITNDQRARHLPMAGIPHQIRTQVHVGALLLDHIRSDPGVVRRAYALSPYSELTFDDLDLPSRSQGA